MKNKPEGSEASVAPFSLETVTLTKQDYIQLISERNRYQSLHASAAKRSLWYQEHYRTLLHYGKEQTSKRELKLSAELAIAQAKIRDLNQRVFGRHSERSKGRNEGHETCASKRPRGHQKGVKNHGRSMLTELPVVHETIDLIDPACPKCGKPLRSMPGTEDSEVVEIEVKAYVRKIHRKRYTGQCDCEACNTIVCAPLAPKIIPKGKFGISVLSTVLLDKYLYGRPSERLLHDLGDHGLEMAPGTLAGGLQKIAPLFEPIDNALLQKLRSQTHWHADETRWAMFVMMEGKVGYRWYLWVFHSKEVVHYARQLWLSDPQNSITQPAHQLGALSLRLVKGTAQSRLCNGYIALHHNFGYGLAECLHRNFSNNMGVHAHFVISSVSLTKPSFFSDKDKKASAGRTIPSSSTLGPQWT